MAALAVFLTAPARGALPASLAELYRSVDEDTARASAACERTEDVHVCPAAVGGATKQADFCCVNPRPASDPNMNNCGGTRPTGLPFAGRSPVYAQHGMAATSVPLSTICALDMLKAGGSAVDGAIAANACEGVVEPMMNGMGGDLMAQVWHGPTKKLHGYNGSGRSPRNVSYEAMKAHLAAQGLKRIPGDGPLGVSTPGAVLGWWDLHQKFGKLPWASLFAPAIAYAESGHPVAQVIAAEWYVPPNSSTLTSGGKYPHALDGFLQTFTVRDGASGERRTPRAGEIFRNPALASTLRAVASGGAAEFYNGSIARAFADYSAESGLLITAEDLRLHHGEWVTPVSTTYRGKRIFELPPNPQGCLAPKLTQCTHSPLHQYQGTLLTVACALCVCACATGIAALQMLNLLELYDLQNMGFNSADYLHVQIEAKKLAFADRAKFYVCDARKVSHPRPCTTSLTPHASPPPRRVPHPRHGVSRCSPFTRLTRSLAGRAWSSSPASSPRRTLPSASSCSTCRMPPARCRLARRRRRRPCATASQRAQPASRLTTRPPTRCTSRWPTAKARWSL